MLAPRGIGMPRQELFRGPRLVHRLLEVIKALRVPRRNREQMCRCLQREGDFAAA